MVVKEKLLFKQVYSCLSSRAYVNIIGRDGSVIKEGMVMDTDFSSFMDCPVKEIDPDLQKVEKVLTIGVMNIKISKK